MVTDHGRTWCSIAEAARALGISERAVRKRIVAGRLETRRETIGNRVRTRVTVPAPGPGAATGAGPGAVPDAAAVRDLLLQVARLEERLAAAEAVRADRDRELAEVKADRARLLALVEQLAAERRPERRPWPGLRRWWRRFVEGEG